MGQRKNVISDVFNHVYHIYQSELISIGLATLSRGCGIKVASLLPLGIFNIKYGLDMQSRSCEAAVKLAASFTKIQQSLMHKITSF